MVSHKQEIPKRFRSRLQGMPLNVKFTLIITALTAAAVLLASIVVFRQNRKITIQESLQNVENLLERDYDTIQKQAEALNICTQFFLSDDNLTGFLLRIKNGDPISTRELLDFDSRTIASLERMVNSNSALYQVRVYAESDSVQEMMPILYSRKRLQKISWYQDEPLAGWKFDYADTLFDRRNNEEHLLSLVTEIEDSASGRIGVLETAMPMENMFPQLFGGTETIWYCFVDENGVCHTSGDKSPLSESLPDSWTTPGSLTDSEFLFQKNGSARLAMGAVPVKELSGVLICVSDISGDLSRLTESQFAFGAAMLGMLLFLAAAVNLIVKRILRQFYRILDSIGEIQKGRLDVVIKDCGTDEMGILGSQINKMLERIRQLMEENTRREMLAKNSQIRALQNQINAHFLYNVLESVKMMAEVDEEYEIADAVTSLGKLMRYNLSWKSPAVTVREEIDYIKNYLLLMNLRFDYEVYLSLRLPEEVLMQTIPKMSLQPIVENSIRHGISELAADNTIYIKGWVQDGECIIEVSDSGCGIAPENLRKLQESLAEDSPDGSPCREAGENRSSSESGDSGIGLKNVRDRIRMTFGAQYGLTMDSRLGCYTKVTLRLPATWHTGTMDLPLPPQKDMTRSSL